MKVCKCVVWLAFGPAFVYGHEVPTHRNLTRAAVEFLVLQEPSLACAAHLEADLQTGTAAEDNVPRPMFHFSPRLDNVIRGYIEPLGVRVMATCDSLQWGFQHPDPPCSQIGYTIGPVTHELRPNTHTWDAAIRSASMDGFLDLGYLVHLLEDLGSPAHTRNDPHPSPFDPDLFEIENAGRSLQTPTISTRLLVFSGPEEYFRSLQHITQTRYFSKDTVFDSALPGPVEDPAHPDKDYIYDKENRRIAYKTLSFRLSHDRRDCTINRALAREQFFELWPIIVQHVASFVKYYVDTIHPRLAACPSVPRRGF